MSVVQYTDAGLAELVSAKNSGIRGEITHIAAGDKSYTPLASQTALVNERQRVAVGDYEEPSLTQIRMGAVFSGSLEYEVREVGFFLASGTLLAVYSEPNKLLTYKSSNSDWVQKFTLDISMLPTDSVTIQVGTENINLMLSEEFATIAVAFIRSQTVQTKISHQQMQLNERLRLSGVS